MPATIKAKASVTVADCLRQHAPAYLTKFGKRMPAIHRKVISALVRCRTGQLGGTVYACDSCGRSHWVGRSCGNRHCSTCGKPRTETWLARQQKRLMPVHHFLVTFTVPEEIRQVMRRNQRAGYAALFDAASESIRDCGAATKSLRGCTLGFFGVLHTWGRDPMVYHPHLHFVVPGGGVGEDSRWHATPENFLFHHGTLVRLYQAKLADYLRAAGLYDACQIAFQKKFVVDIKPVGDGGAVLKYLAPYVNRVAISDRRIVACDDSTVTFRYTPSGAKQTKTRTVTGEEFVRGFAQHILPPGFQKIRHYGWMSPHSKISLDEVKWLVWLFLGWTYWLASGHAPPEPTSSFDLPRCRSCGGRLRIDAVVHWNCESLVTHCNVRDAEDVCLELGYLDSG